MEEAKKPLHVRVAEALGWIALEAPNGMWPDEYFGFHPEFAPIVGRRAQVPDYTKDWSATGPLIEKYGITVSDAWPAFGAWTAALHGTLHMNSGGAIERGPTPLVAVCNLIVALKEAGKL